MADVKHRGGGKEDMVEIYKHKTTFLEAYIMTFLKSYNNTVVKVLYFVSKLNIKPKVAGRAPPLNCVVKCQNERGHF